MCRYTAVYSLTSRQEDEDNIILDPIKADYILAVALLISLQKKYRIVPETINHGQQCGHI